MAFKFSKEKRGYHILEEHRLTVRLWTYRSATKRL